MINTVFVKTIENIRDYIYIKIATTDARRNNFVYEPNYHITKSFLENSLAIEIKRTHKYSLLNQST